MTAQAFDPTEFRKALGTFATGVTIITARTVDGTPVGLTANSFNSVSLSPPLVLWSLANTSANLEVFRAAEYWAVHVLRSEEHTSELQSLMRISYAVFCLKKTNTTHIMNNNTDN